MTSVVGLGATTVTVSVGSATLRGEDIFGQIGQQPKGLIGIARLLVDEGADGHGQLEILAGVAGPIRTLVVRPAEGMATGS